MVLHGVSAGYGMGSQASASPATAAKPVFQTQAIVSDVGATPTPALRGFAKYASRRVWSVHSLYHFVTPARTRRMSPWRKSTRCSFAASWMASSEMA